MECLYIVNVNNMIWYEHILLQWSFCNLERIRHKFWKTYSVWITCEWRSYINAFSLVSADLLFFLESCTDRLHRFIPCLKIMVRKSIVFIWFKNPKETVHRIYELVEWTRDCAFELARMSRKTWSKVSISLQFILWILWKIFIWILNKWIFLCCSLFAPLSEAHILKPCVSNGYISSECIVILKMILIMRKKGGVVDVSIDKH